MKRIYCLLFSLVMIVTVHAQKRVTDSIATINLRMSAERMMKFYADTNYHEYVKYLHPKVLKVAGGTDQIIQLLRTGNAGMRADGFVLSDINMGTPSTIVTTATEMQVIIPQIIEFKTSQGRLITTGYLLGISSDKGKTWRFADTAGKTLEQMKQVFSIP